jgi:hypothetical protein
MIVDLAFQRGPQQFLPNVPEFVQEFANATNLTSAQVSVGNGTLFFVSESRYLMAFQEGAGVCWIQVISGPILITVGLC